MVIRSISKSACIGVFQHDYPTDQLGGIFSSMKQQKKFVLRPEHYIAGLIFVFAFAAVREFVIREGEKAGDWAANRVDRYW